MRSPFTQPMNLPGTGRIRNELIGVIFADGEMSSNLRWTQAIYDQMKTNGMLKTPDPLDEDDVISAAKTTVQTTVQTLMNEEFIVHTDFIGDPVQSLLNEVKSQQFHFRVGQG